MMVAFCPGQSCAGANDWPETRGLGTASARHIMCAGALGTVVRSARGSVTRKTWAFAGRQPPRGAVITCASSGADLAPRARRGRWAGTIPGTICWWRFSSNGWNRRDTAGDRQ